ncbi:hypothetical protein F7725_023590 [Dissostichus mawsoni]|uniref:Uncharacterized protein n=1 Tax=Dissostichus mawsoni TaxID=36200 RepID=A0A7J5XYK6_DISMA|nr:hypothetical protein F7725_023590 [Dissostichus mawsoni]
MYSDDILMDRSVSVSVGVVLALLPLSSGMEDDLSTETTAVQRNSAQNPQLRRNTGPDCRESPGRRYDGGLHDYIGVFDVGFTLHHPELQLGGAGPPTGTC